jgi:hypothetical protein
MRTILFLSVIVLLPAGAPAEEAPAGLDQLSFLVGTWRGTSTGEPGNGSVSRVCERILNDRFVECRSTVIYPPQEKNPKGETHVERAIYSFDKKAKKLRLRQFHGEGFVNSYVEAAPLTFETNEIENIPPGWRARETYKPVSPDVLEETFELAMPGKEFAVYSGSKLERVK